MDPDPDPRIHAIDYWIRIRLLDPDPAIFVIDLQDAKKNKFKKKQFSAFYFLKVYLHHFSKIKSHKNYKIVENKVFLTIFA